MDGQHRWLVVAALLTALAVPVVAAPDWNRVDDPLKGGIGLHAGKIGGSGLALKYPLAWYLQLQVAGGVWRTSDTRWGNFGMELQYLLRQDPRLRLYLVGGAAMYNNQDKKHDEYGQEYWQNDEQWNVGFGVGAERLLGERWAVNIDVDFTYQEKEESVTIWPQVGLLFYW